MSTDQPALPVNRRELAEMVAADTGMPHAAADRAVRATLTAIARSVAAGRPVTITHFGSFLPRTLKERPARNPMTGQTLTAPAQRVVKFRPTGRLRRAVRAGDPEGFSLRKKPSGQYPRAAK